MKYYFLCYMFKQYPNADQVLKDVHPFKTVDSYKKTLFDAVLLSWQEITKEEYDLYKKLEDAV